MVEDCCSRISTPRAAQAGPTADPESKPWGLGGTEEKTSAVVSAYRVHAPALDSVMDIKYLWILLGVRPYAFICILELRGGGVGSTNTSCMEIVRKRQTSLVGGSMEGNVSFHREAMSTYGFVRIF